MQTLYYVGKLHSHTKNDHAVSDTRPLRTILGLETGNRTRESRLGHRQISELPLGSKLRASVYPALLSVIFDLEARTCFDMLSIEF